MRYLAMAVACATVCGGGAVASAAELSLKDTPVFAPAPAPVWSGPYIGGHIGGLWTGDSTTSALEQVCQPGGGGGGDHDHGGKDHDDDKDHHGGKADDYKHGKKGKYGDHDDDKDRHGGKDDDYKHGKNGKYGDHDDDKDHHGERNDDYKDGKKSKYGDHDDGKDHHGEKDGDYKDGKKSKYGEHDEDGKTSTSSPVQISVAAMPTTTPPSAPVCTDFTKTSNVVFEEDKDDVTLIGGLHIGYNWQRESAIVGVEADVDFADEFDYLATLRGRLGFVSGDFLLYATAGIAFAGLEDSTLNVRTPLASYSFDRGDDTQVGAVLGAGVEYKLASNVSVGLEGLYYFFGDERNSFSITEGDTTYRITEDRDNDVWTIRARVTYHFGGGEPYVPLK